MSKWLHLGLIFQASQDDALKQREALINDVVCLRGELQQTRDDRDHLSSQVEVLTTEVVKYKECTGKSFAELENLSVKSNELEVRLYFCFFQHICLHYCCHKIWLLLQARCLSQSDLIKSLQEKLGFAEKKLQVSIFGFQEFIGNSGILSESVVIL